MLAKRLLLGACLLVSSMVGGASVAAQEEEPAPSQMYLDVGNPAPGDMVHVGGLMIEGIAFDRASEDGPGIDHIDIFLEDRDQAGSLIGHAALGIETPSPEEPELANSGWNAQVMLTRTMTGAHTLFFYALSGVTGEEMVVAIPVEVVP